MIEPGLAKNEAQRLARLAETGLSFDSKGQASFDKLTYLAAHISGCPIALMSLVDSSCQWFKSKVGLEASQTSRDISFCGHVVEAKRLIIVPDTLQDERFWDNPLVTGSPFIRFYAGFPLLVSEDIALGTLCIIDSSPRRLLKAQCQAMQSLADLCVDLIGLHSVSEGQASEGQA